MTPEYKRLKRYFPIARSPPRPLLPWGNLFVPIPICSTPLYTLWTVQENKLTFILSLSPHKILPALHAIKGAQIELFKTKQRFPGCSVCKNSGQMRRLVGFWVEQNSPLFLAGCGGKIKTFRCTLCAYVLGLCGDQAKHSSEITRKQVYAHSGPVSRRSAVA